MTQILTAGCQLGDYRLEQKIALGGMAEIWSARRVEGGEAEPLVALKVLYSAFAEDSDFRNMFWDEVHIAQRLQHAHIARVHASQEADGHLFQVLELLDGIDLRRLMSALSQRRQWLPAPYALMIARDMARGLSYAHQRKTDSGGPMNIVHRDISPHNVMVVREGIAKVLDFGIARASERRSRTQTGVVKGKMSYMSPEQALGTSVDARTDIFACGVVLWEMLAMDRLFKGDTETETLQKLVKAEVPPIGSRNSTVPEDAADLIHRMLAQKPDQRPATMGEVENQLNRVLARSYDADQVAASTLAEWLGPFLDGPSAGASRGRQTAVMPVEESTEITKPQPVVTSPSALTEPDEVEGPPTRVDLEAPSFED